MSRKIFFAGLLVPSIVFFEACKKDTAPSPLAPTPSACFQSRSVTDGTIIPDQYIVTYSPSFTSDSMKGRPIAELSTTLLNRNGISKASLRASFGGDIKGFVAKLSNKEVDLLKHDAAINLIEQDKIITLDNCFKVSEPRLITWNVQHTGYGDGIGKTAWIIDTGIDFTHPDLTVDKTRSKNFISGQTSANDDNGHGTHVAGIIGAKNNSIGMLGVASGATLVALKVLSADGEGAVSGMIQALAYVNANGKAGDVVNMSLGEDGLSEILNQQVQYTASKGIYIAIAAGNEGKAADTFSPASANGKNIYTVSAVDSLNNFASFSNFGNDAVDYAAPGVNILSCWSNGRYAYASGTSMAAPHVAGLLLINNGVLHSFSSALKDPDGAPDPIAHK